MNIGFTSGGKVVIDIGTESIKIMDISTKSKKVTINKAYKLEGMGGYSSTTDITNLKGIVERIVESFKENGIKSKQIVLNFPTKSMDTKYMSAPDMSKKELKEFMEMTYMEEFPNSSPETHCMDYTLLGNILSETGSDSPIIVATVPKVIILNMVKAFQRQGYRVVDIDTPITPLHYLSQLYNDYDSSNKMFVDIGENSIRVMLTTEGVPLFVRESLGGVSKITGELGRGLDISNIVAEELVRKAGVDKKSANSGIYSTLDSLDITEDEYFDEVEIAVLEVVNEITKNIEFIKMSMKLNTDSIVLVGGGALIQGLPEIIAERTGVDVEYLEIVSSVNVDELHLVNNSNKTIDSSYGSCLGLSLKEVIG